MHTVSKRQTITEKTNVLGLQNDSEYPMLLNIDYSATALLELDVVWVTEMRNLMKPKTQPTSTEELPENIDISDSPIGEGNTILRYTAREKQFTLKLEPDNGIILKVNPTQQLSMSVNVVYHSIETDYTTE